MKKVLCLGLFMVALFVLAACSPSSPGAAVKQYAEYFKDGKYEKFVEGIALKKKGNGEQEKLKPEEKEGLVAMIKEKGAKQVEKKDGIKNIEIVSETVEEDGNKATVVLKQTYGNGDEEEQTYRMVKEDGKWKMDISK